MESQREDLPVILAGYGDRMDKFFASNPGFRSRIAHHIDFPDYFDEDLLSIAELLPREVNYRFTPESSDTFVRYIALHKTQPLFSNARSIRSGWTVSACARPTGWSPISTAYSPPMVSCRSSRPTCWQAACLEPFKTDGA